MNWNLYIPIFLALVGAAATTISSLRRRSGHRGLVRLEMLTKTDQSSMLPPAVEPAASLASVPLARLSDRFGRAGAFQDIDRRSMGLKLFAVTSAGLFSGIFISIFVSLSKFGVFLAVCGGLNFGACAALLILRAEERRHERLTLYYLPLVMEQLILLIEAGLGLLPALHQVVSRRAAPDRPAGDCSRECNPVQQVLALIYYYSSAGMSFGSAIETVAAAVPNRALRHVLLHLDIGAADGGELIPALRGLSDFCHQEWKHSVEGRIKRLENAVIFPVFLSVLGLMVLVAAVPLVPLISLRERLSPESIISNSSDHSISAAVFSRRREQER